MSVNVKCIINPAARVDDVAKVVGILLGCKVVYKSFPSGGGHVVVEGVKAEPGYDASMPYIKIYLNKDNPVAAMIRETDGDVYHLHYFYETEYGKGEHALHPANTPAKIAMCVGVAKFFGGWVDFNDCDDVEVNFRARAGEYITARNGEEWENLQKRFLELEPLTLEDVKCYETEAWKG